MLVPEVPQMGNNVEELHDFQHTFSSERTALCVLTVFIYLVTDSIFALFSSQFVVSWGHKQDDSRGELLYCEAIFLIREHAHVVLARFKDFPVFSNL